MKLKLFLLLLLVAIIASSTLASGEETGQNNKSFGNQSLGKVLTQDEVMEVFSNFSGWDYQLPDNWLEGSNSKNDRNTVTTINKTKGDFRFIAIKGIIPDTIDQEWKNLIVDCWVNITGPSYYKFDKSIKTIHPHGNLLIVELYSCYGGEINVSKLDDIYHKLENYCEVNNGINDIPVVFMWADDNGVLPHVYDPDAFKKAKNNSDFIVYWGVVPTFADEDERLQWSESVWEARHIDKLQSYIGDPVLFYGFVENSAYIEVGINKNTLEKVNNSVIEEIYQIIDEHYKENGINDIPVVFTWSEPFELSVATLNETPKWMEDNITNLSTEERVNATKRNKTSGFTSIMLVMCLLILVRIKR